MDVVDFVGASGGAGLVFAPGAFVAHRQLLLDPLHWASAMIAQQQAPLQVPLHSQ